jgi:peptidoglycan hydrolase CwlO-like protein
MLQFRIESLEKDNATHLESLRKSCRQLEDAEAAAKDRLAKAKSDAKADEDELRRRISELEIQEQRAAEAAENARESLESVREVDGE